MAGILDIFNLFPVKAQDVVSIFRDTNGEFSQIASGARPVVVRGKEEAQFMQHPVEDGTSIVDHRVIQPIEIEIRFILTPKTYLDTYNELKQVYLRGDKLAIRTRTGLYQNLYIVGIPHQEDPEMYDTITMTIKFREVQFVQAQFATLPPQKVVNKKNSSTVNRGTQTAKTANSAQQSASESIIHSWVN